MTHLLKAVSVLLSYPSGPVRAALGVIEDVVAADTRLTPACRSGLLALVADLAASDPFDAEERYVRLFDRTRMLSLHLFEHVHGESRDRGQAMVDLMAMYEEAGFVIAARELPDYLPLFIEFLSTRDQAVASDLLASTAHILAGLGQRIAGREPLYVAPFAALIELSGAAPDPALVEALLAVAPDDPDDLESLDAVWEEEAVTFGGNAGEGACGPDRLGRQIRAARRPPADQARTQPVG